MTLHTFNGPAGRCQRVMSDLNAKTNLKIFTAKTYNIVIAIVRDKTCFDDYQRKGCVLVDLRLRCVIRVYQVFNIFSLHLSRITCLLLRGCVRFLSAANFYWFAVKSYKF